MTTLPKPIAVSPHARMGSYVVPIRNYVPKHTESYKVSYEYINNSPIDLYVVDINNQSMIIHTKNRGDRAGGGFSILKHYEWDDKKVTFNVNNLYSEGEGSGIKYYVDDETKKSNKFKDVFATMLTDASNTSNIQSYRRGSVILNVSDKLFRENNSCIYIKELGIVVTTENQVDYTVHPASTKGLALFQAETLQHPSIFQLFANDPQRKEFGTRYINLNNSVYKVPVIANPAMSPGVYITESVSGTGDDYSETVSNLKRYDFLEADTKLNLYRTYSEAKDHYGYATAQLTERNIFKTREFAEYQDKAKREAEELKLENAKLKMDQELEYTRLTNGLKREIELLKGEAELRNSQLKEKADKMEYRSMDRKDNYEAASYSRKGWGEIIKWIPGIVAGALTCVGIAFALFL